MMSYANHITEQIEDDFENYIYVDEYTEAQASRILRKEWDLTAQEVNDIISNYWKKQEDIDITNDLGEII